MNTRRQLILTFSLLTISMQIAPRPTQAADDFRWSPIDAIQTAVRVNDRVRANRERVHAIGEDADAIRLRGGPRVFLEGEINQTSGQTGGAEFYRAREARAGVRMTVFDGGAARHEAQAEKSNQLGTKAEYDSVYTSYGTTTATVATAVGELYSELAATADRVAILNVSISEAEKLKSQSTSPAASETIQAFSDQKREELAASVEASELSQIRLRYLLSASESLQIRTLPLDLAIAAVTVPAKIDEAIAIGFDQNPDLVTARHYRDSADEKIRQLRAVRSSPVVEASVARVRLHEQTGGVSGGSPSAQSTTRIGITASWSFGQSEAPEMRGALKRKDAWSSDVEGTAKAMETDLRVSYAEIGAAMRGLAQQTKVLQAAQIASAKTSAGSQGIAEKLNGLREFEAAALPVIALKQKILMSRIRIQRILGFYVDRG